MEAISENSKVMHTLLLLLFPKLKYIREKVIRFCQENKRKAKIQGYSIFEILKKNSHFKHMQFL